MGRKRFERAKELSTWRRIALHLWNHPRDPTVYGNLEINMRTACEYLRQVNELHRGAKVTVTHLVAKAIARALAEHPEANAIVARRRIYYRRSVDVFCQVATAGGKDLSGVKISNVDRKKITEIADELHDRVERLRRGRDSSSERAKRTILRVPHPLLGTVIRAAEFLSYDLRLDLSRFGIEQDQFGSAMVSNVGGFGLSHGLAPLVPATRTPIVLLVGKIEDRPVVEDGRLSIAPCLTIGCTFDHRLIDGYQAGVMASIVTATLSDPFRYIGLPIRSSSIGDRIVLPEHETTSSDRTGSSCTDRTGESHRPEDPPRVEPGD
ncbi:MAG: 2-oxo acid dehydrogenase [Candidatus Dadabacteria bacterium]|nr:MAG: 2-oxo acid dehydrogenase [Candidatus Dadabacteria bacterium]